MKPPTEIVEGGLRYYVLPRRAINENRSESTEEMKKFWSPCEEYYFVFPNKESNCHTKEDSFSVKICRKDETELFEVSCDRYRAAGRPLFFCHKGQTYLLGYPAFGCYKIFDMKGDVVSAWDDTGYFLSRIVQLDDNTLWLNAWVWQPCLCQIKITIDKSLETGEFSTLSCIADPNESDMDDDYAFEMYVSEYVKSIN